MLETFFCAAGVISYVACAFFFWRQVMLDAYAWSACRGCGVISNVYDLEGYCRVCHFNRQKWQEWGEYVSKKEQEGT